MSSHVSPSEAAVWKPRAPRLALVPQLRERVLDRTAAWLAARGVRRIALYGMGRHSRAIIRQPWLLHGIEVAAVLDDRPTGSRLVGVPVLLPAEARDGAAGVIDAVVVSSTVYEDQIADRAAEVFAGSSVEIVRLYTPDDSVWDVGPTIERLVARGLERTDAEWLVHNRAERHDAMLPVIPPARTELHLRRYEMAAGVALERGARTAADLACGTGYGSELLARVAGLRSVVGADIDADAVRYAGRYHDADGRARFVCADATDTGLESGSIDLIASFETIEHVVDTGGLLAEFDRLLRPGGTLVVSTPNRMGPTPYHVHDFGFPEFSAALRSRFQVVDWFGQLPTDDVYAADLPPGMWRLAAKDAARDVWPGGGGRPDFLLAVCRKPDLDRCDAVGGDSVVVRTPLGAVRLATPLGHSGISSGEPGEWGGPVWAWLGTLSRGDVLWDAAPGDPVAAIAASVRCSQTLLLRPAAADHWVAWASLRLADQHARACCLAVGVTGWMPEGSALPHAAIEMVAAMAGVGLPTHLRLGAWTPGAAEALGRTRSLREVFVETVPRAAAERASMVGSMSAAGFLPAELGSGGGGVGAGAAVFRRQA